MKLAKLGFFIAVLTASIFGQNVTPTRVTSQNRTGELPYSSTIGSDFETVDIPTGNLMVNIPILSVPGRGQNANLALRYNALFWSVKTTTPDGVRYFSNWQAENRPYFIGALGWELTAPRISFTQRLIDCNYVNPPALHTFLQQNYIFYDSTGGKYKTAAQKSANCSFSDPDSPDTATVGVRVKIPGSASLSEAYLSDGTRFAASAGNSAWRDSNGNLQGDISAGGVDTLGRSLVQYASPNSNQRTITIKNASGGDQTYTVNFQTITIDTAFATAGCTFGTTKAPSSAKAIASIVLPNSQSYTFSYDAYGGITHIGLPTGASVDYTWETIGTGKWQKRVVKTRSVTVNGQTSTWTINRSSALRVDDPLGNAAVYGMTYGDAVSSVSIYAGAPTGTPKRRYVMTYASSLVDPVADPGEPPPDPCDEPPDSPVLGQRLTKIETFFDDGTTTSRKEFDYETISFTVHNQLAASLPNSMPGTTTYSSSNGNITEIREYGFDGLLTRKITKAYLHSPANDPAGNYSSRNIIDKIIRETVYDGAANVAADTKFTYDGYSGDTAFETNDTATAPQRDAAFTTSFTYRGNATKVERWRNKSSASTNDPAWIATLYKYDIYGNLRGVKDAGGHWTKWVYLDAFGQSTCAPGNGLNGQAYTTKVINALNHEMRLTRLSCTGQMLSQKDQNDIDNGRGGSTFTYDFMNRSDITNFPDGGQTDIDYDDANRWVRTRQLRAAGNNVSYLHYDDLGRTWRAEVCEDGTDACVTSVKTDTAYDSLGRVSTVTNPYRTTGDTTYGVTTSTYDALSRVTRLTHPDSFYIDTNYAVNCTNVTDESSRQRISCADPLGRLTQVKEPDPTSGVIAYDTNYSHDALGNLVCAEQRGNVGSSGPTCANGQTGGNWRVRRFTYNSLGQLLSANNPESGLINYTYDNDGNLSTKTDARGISTTYSYDALHRLTNNSALQIAYLYDLSSAWGVSLSNTIGRLAQTSVGSTVGSIFSYDAMGRVKQNWDCAPSNCGSGSYYKAASYDVAGNLISLTYPSERTVSFGVDAANRADNVTFASFNGTPLNYTYWQVPASYQSTSGFWPNGTPHFEQFAGTTTLATTVVTNRFWPSATSLITPTGTAMWRDYGYMANGNLTQITDNLDSAKTQNFRYDYLNRITDAWTTGNTWANNYVVDAWGNLTKMQACTRAECTGKPLGQNLNVTADNSNRFVGSSYDAAGNMLNDGANTLVYDAEGHISSSTLVGTTTNNTYDANGMRVRKQTGTNWTEYVYFGSEVIAEKDQTGVWTDYIFAGGNRIAKAPATVAITGTEFYHGDHLGSTRLMTDPTGAIIYSGTFLPYGKTWSETGSSTNHYKFTGKERDSESGLDYFGARYYGSASGRWLSPDWSATPTAVPYADFGDPQTLNLYGYVRNNPLRHADLDGHCWPASDCAEVLDQAIDRVVDSAIGMSVANRSEYDAAEDAFFFGTAGDIAKGATNLLRFGSDVGNVGDHVGQGDYLSAANDIAQDGARAAVIGAAVAAKGEAPTTKEGIYEGADATSPGRTYVGQSGNIPRRLGEHEASGKFAPNTKVKTTEVRGGKTAREIAEQKRLNELGGIKSNPGSKSSNIRNPIGNNREHLMKK